LVVTKDEARELIIDKWLALPPDERATERQAAWFAMAIKDRYRFRSSGDRYQVIKGWLLSLSEAYKGHN
jgi:hypothetical protein